MASTAATTYQTDRINPSAGIMSNLVPLDLNKIFNWILISIFPIFDEGPFNASLTNLFFLNLLRSLMDSRIGLTNTIIVEFFSDVDIRISGRRRKRDSISNECWSICEDDRSPILNSSHQQIDGWNLFCPASQTHDQLFTHFFANKQTFNLLSSKILNSTEMNISCSSLVVTPPPVTDR